MTTATQNHAQVMRNTKAELADEVMSLRKQLGEPETATTKPGLTGISGDAAIGFLIDAIESTSEGFSIYDADHRLTHCNSAFKGLYHYADADVAGGPTAAQLVALDIERGTVAKNADVDMGGGGGSVNDIFITSSIDKNA